MGNGNIFKNHYDHRHLPGIAIHVVQMCIIDKHKHDTNAIFMRTEMCAYTRIKSR